ncbi:MAG: hypothetical protein U5K37_12780 [Natrialbaceae archaeon]|nr:hypothetical protein [Natrialbaceae archaeon]
MGGVLSFRSEGPVESTADLERGAFAELRETVRQALYQDAPAFGSIQTVADLERLCAIAAHRRAEPIKLAECASLFDVDRRTITESYLPTLGQLYRLTGVTEFDNSRPRTVQRYLRDTGLVTALTGGDPSAVKSDRALEADLARLAGFDHTMRLSYMVHAVRNETIDPAVSFWNAPDGQVDFVFQVDGHRSRSVSPIGPANTRRVWRPSRHSRSAMAVPSRCCSWVTNWAWMHRSSGSSPGSSGSPTGSTSCSVEPPGENDHPFLPIPPIHIQ